MTAIDIKAAFFDIDGTLTSFTTHVVPQSTIDALRALQSNGVKIFICTGRPPAQMNVVLDAYAALLKKRTVRSRGGF